MRLFLNLYSYPFPQIIPKIREGRVTEQEIIQISAVPETAGDLGPYFPTITEGTAKCKHGGHQLQGGHV